MPSSAAFLLPIFSFLASLVLFSQSSLACNPGPLSLPVSSSASHRIRQARQEGRKEGERGRRKKTEVRHVRESCAVDLAFLPLSFPLLLYSLLFLSSPPLRVPFSLIQFNIKEVFFCCLCIYLCCLCSKTL